MRSTLRLLALPLVALAVLTSTACRSGAPAGGAGGWSKGDVAHLQTGMRATANNRGVWVVHSTNYIGAPKALPFGSTITLGSVGRDRFDFTDEQGADFHARFIAKHNMITFPDWLGRQLSKEPVTLPEGLSEAERTAIEEAVVEVGMSRAAVFLAVGYPPASLSPDFDARQLTYESARFNKLVIKFGDDDRVSEIVD